uniref:B cell linker n=1 Tax=Nannospalax galili TaxID=1026970 RepID=A0A8C6REE5_NANGA
MDKLNKITVPASQKLRQLQKMVHDIKNNEGGIMNKIKKLKVKAPPSVPRRDYALESPAEEEEQWSDDFDSDYENPDEHSDSEMYVMPAEENGDDSYEPPPAEQHTRTVHPALPFARGEYVDNRSSQRHSPPFSKTLPSKPISLLPGLWMCLKSCVCISVSFSAPMVNRSTKPNSSSRLVSPSGRTAGRNSGVWDSKSSLPAAPSPLPRNSLDPEKPIPAERHRGSSHRQDTVQSPVFPPAQKPVHQKPVPLPRFSEGGSPTVDPPLPSFSSNSTFSDQEADLLCKPWYAGACDRKSAEEALHRSSKDGSFLIRKSSGHDSKQPYTLVVFFNKRVYNIPVRFIEATKQYALGRKKNGEEYFGSVVEIIKNHQHSPLVLIDSQNNTKDSTRLKYAVKVS